MVDAHPMAEGPFGAALQAQEALVERLGLQPDSGAGLIAAERRRQIDEEGWTPGHDAEHDLCQMVDAAVHYAVAATRLTYGWDLSMVKRRGVTGIHWPWDASWWKPSHDPVRNLVKAGALIAAEIDRLRAKEENG